MTAPFSRLSRLISRVRGAMPRQDSKSQRTARFAIDGQESAEQPLRFGFDRANGRIRRSFDAGWIHREPANVGQDSAAVHPSPNLPSSFHRAGPVSGLTAQYAYMYICTIMNSSAFQALADPTRLRIVEALRASGESPVNDLVDGVAIDQSGVSRHLRILRDAGFVQVRPDGARRLYSLKAKPFHDLEIWISRYRILWEARLDKFAEELERRQRTRGSHGTEGAS